MRTLVTPLCVLVLALAAVAPARAAPAVPESPDAVLDALHARAAAADFEGYFDLYTEDAVFLGTDASERWPVDAFRAYTRARFATGTGWTYVPVERHLMGEGDLIWFDELLEGEVLGACRGTGVLRREDGRWRVAHYSLTVLVPNEIVVDVVAQGRAAVADRADP